MVIKKRKKTLKAFEVFGEFGSGKAKRSFFIQSISPRGARSSVTRSFGSDFKITKVKRRTRGGKVL